MSAVSCAVPDITTVSWATSPKLSTRSSPMNNAFRAQQRKQAHHHSKACTENFLRISSSQLDRAHLSQLGLYGRQLAAALEQMLPACRRSAGSDKLHQCPVAQLQLPHPAANSQLLTTIQHVMRLAAWMGVRSDRRNQVHLQRCNAHNVVEDLRQLLADQQKSKLMQLTDT